jgi:hypothetical protein
MALQLVKISTNGKVRIHISALAKPVLTDLFAAMMAQPPRKSELNGNTVGEKIAIALAIELYDKLRIPLLFPAEPTRITVTESEALTLWGMLSFAECGYDNPALGALFMDLHQKLSSR